MSMPVPDMLPLCAAIRRGEGRRFLFPPCSDREAWRAIAECPGNRTVVAALLRQAEEMLDTPIPQPNTSDALRYMADGDRDTFEYPYFSRRNMLSVLVLAMALTGEKARWLPRIVDLLGAIAAETFWCVPAHCDYDPVTRDCFPLDSSRRKSDLFASGTTATVALTLALLGKELEEYSPRFVEHIRTVALEHTIRPIIAGDPKVWWLAGINNWTPWCAHNLLIGGIALLESDEELAALFEILYGSVERFIDRYPEDGYCDEGASYWERAGGEALGFLHRVEMLLPGSMKDFCHSPKMRNMAEFPIHMQIEGKLMYIFADGVSSPGYGPGTLYLAAETTGSEALRRFAANYHYNEESVFSGVILCGEVLRTMLDYLSIPHEATAAPAAPPKTVVFPGRLAILRSAAMTAVLKAGVNDESHNHNDLGHFSFYAAGRPVIIDLGSGDYTRQYFSEERYQLLCNGAHGHNAPLFGGAGEEEGNAYHGDLAIGGDGEASIDLGAAYPPALGIEAFQRRLKLDEKGLTVDDRLKRRDRTRPITLNFYTPCEKVSAADGKIHFESAGAVLTPTGATISRVEKLTDYDRRLHLSWGDHLWHIELTVDANADTWQLRFEA